MKRLILALALGASLSPAWPADKDGKFRQFGPPHCDKFLEALGRLRTSPDGIDYPHVVMWAWIAGYLTAYNMNVPDTYDLLGNRDILEIQAEEYCRAHPGDDLAQFMQARIKQLQPSRRRAAGGN